MIRVRLLFIVSIISASVVLGCSAETRYRTLSFFFDGVPDPAAEAGSTLPSGGPRRPSTVKTRPSTHGPYAARLCEACHQRGGSNKLIMPVEELCLNCHDLNIKKKHIHGPVASGGCRVCHEPHGSGRPFLLTEEPRKFCFFCHDEAGIMGRETHRSAGDLQCTDCHDPHSSDNDLLLK